MDLEIGPWKTDNYWVSHHQFQPEVMGQLQLPEKVEFHDSTLRDGEQAPGIVFSPAQKVEIAKMLDAAGFQYIEAGFPPVSKADRDAISEIVSLGLKAKITCLSRARTEDIQMAVDCGVWGAILEVPGSQVRLKYQFGWSEDEVIKKTVAATALAKEKGLAAYLFIMDSARAELSFLIRMINTVEKESGADKVALVDTSGCATPRGWYYLVSEVRKNIDLPIEVHCHNDFGMGVATSLAGIEAGATSVSAVLSGLGQRAGNAPIEEVIWAVQALYGIPTGIDMPKLYEVAIHVQQLSGWSFPPNKPVIGKNLFTWEAGIPTAALRRNPHTVEPFQPEVFGRKHDILLGKKAGKANIEFKLEELGLAELSSDTSDRLLEMVKTESIKLGRSLTNDEFFALYRKATS